MTRFPTREERSERAFRGYLELMEAADWLRAELRLPLDSFEVTRLMAVLVQNDW